MFENLEKFKLLIEAELEVLLQANKELQERVASLENSVYSQINLDQ